MVTEVPKEVLETGQEVAATREERALAFLDTWTVVELDGSISTKVFIKETHLNFDSNHPLEHKRDVVRTLVNKANNLVSGEAELKKEKEHIRQALINTYLDRMLHGPRQADWPDPAEEEQPEQKETGEDSVFPTTTEVIPPLAPGMEEQVLCCTTVCQGHL